MINAFRIALLVCTISLSTAVLAQQGERSVKKKPQGLVLANDSSFKAVLRFRVQNRAFFFTDGDFDELVSTEIRTRRARLRLDGHVLDPRLQYKLQIGFTTADMDAQDGTAERYILRDATVSYALSPHWTILFGQTKLPGNRQRTTSSGQMELPERSSANGLFTLDRDMGLFVTWEPLKAATVLRLRTAITSGEGRAATAGGGGLCYTGRLEWLPFGAFTGENEIQEGDLVGESSPKLSVAATYSTNQRTLRSGGQLGLAFADGKLRSLDNVVVDMLFKYKGWSLLAEYFERRQVGGPALEGISARTVMVNGNAFNLQAGRIFKEVHGISGRYAQVDPIGAGVEGLSRDEAWLGYTRYLNGHRIKLQGALSYGWTEEAPAFDQVGNRWGFLLQVELGI